ncbi:MAG: CHAD domain-containing protein [Thainema sp.]
MKTASQSTPEQDSTPKNGTSKQTSTGKTSSLTPLHQYAHEAIRKHFKKSTKYLDDVLCDRDPEDVHQMRVGMRRLRTALQVFEGVVVLPSGLSIKKIGKLAKALGNVRDLDVMLEWLQSYLEKADPKVIGALAPVMERVQKKRKKCRKRLRKVLKGKQYAAFEQGFQTWLEQPKYTPVAELPLEQVLPDLLLPLISELLLHPGWLVATSSTKQKGIQPTKRLNQTQIHQVLKQDSDDLHDLRKQMKRVRYQTEFFTEFYGDSYQAQTEEFRVIQDLLGQLQDGAILSEFLADELDADWPKQLPDLHQQLQQEQIDIWRQWQPIQAKYLTAEFRQQLRQLVLTPGAAPTASPAADKSPAPDTPSESE